MRPVFPGRFDLSPREAKEEQQRLRVLLRDEPLRREDLRLVAGCDVAAAGESLCAVVVVFAFPELELVEKAEAVGRAPMPYVPGLLSFREVPVLLDAFARLRAAPQAVLCDGQGRAHPRRFGLACHLGLLLDLPAAGCAKSRLVGEHAEPGERRGAWAPLTEGQEIIGSVLRTRDRVRPLYVSAGHRLTLEDAVWLVLQCGAGYRLPEPTRIADGEVGELARRLRREAREAGEAGEAREAQEGRNKSPE